MFCFKSDGDQQAVCQDFTETNTNNLVSGHRCDICVSGAAYCDPTWLPRPNLNRALLGIDIAKKHSMPTNPEINPSVKNRIFSSTYRNKETGGMDYFHFISFTDKLACRGVYDTQSWDTMDKFIQGSAKSTMSDWNIGYTGPKATISVGEDGIGASITPPPNFANEGDGTSGRSSKMEAFFHHERGSVSHTKLKCSTYEVSVNINHPNLKLEAGFIEAIKKIDASTTDQEKSNAMHEFISMFGTHYAKKTIMGIGADFETRYNEEETLNYDSNTRNECSSHSGGFRIFGIGKRTSSSKCKGLSDDATTGDNTKVERFVSTTYGTLIQAESLSSWGAKVADEKSLDPVPIQQDLQLITDIFQTKAVADITHNDGSKVDVKKLLKTVIKGFRNYCNYFVCDSPSCAATLSLKTSSRHYIFEDNGHNIEGRPTFLDKSSSNYLFYSQDKWNIGPKIDTSKSILATSMCPHHGSMFEGVNADSSQTFPDILSWLDCSQMCFNSKPPSQCRYWQYEADIKQCTLINDFNKMVSTSSDIYTGTIDCLGDKFQYAYGQCAENFVSKSMWEEPSKAGFLKGLEIKNFDPTIIVTAGGVLNLDTKFQSSEVDVMFQNDCHPPPLPGQFLTSPILALTPGGVLLNCGGQDYSQGYTSPFSKKCYSLDVASGVWRDHSSLTEPRSGGVAITLLSGTYIFGGNSNNNEVTSDYLPASEQSWKPGPKIPGGNPYYLGCGVKVSDTELLLIIGPNLFKYSESEGKLQKMPSQITVVNSPNCALIGNNVIVTTENYKPQIIPLNNFQPRYADGKDSSLMRDMITVGGHYPRLLAYDAFTSVGEPTDVYQWDEVKEQWWKTALKLKKFLWGQATALAVPSGSVCNMK